MTKISGKQSRFLFPLLMPERSLFLNGHVVQAWGGNCKLSAAFNNQINKINYLKEIISINLR
ncbi:hypothetical protein [Undibacterium sp. RuTC16W]|uniref:hypothetical protein n=1 Tax=Undibacterium sp. RuTC16W TaxID=3413048 RepID=UPI003BEF88BD